MAIVVASFSADVTGAAFGDSDANEVNTFAAGYWGYASQVASDGPSFWWRLGEAGAVPDPVFAEDFEDGFEWTTYGSGELTPTSAIVHGGTMAGLKNGSNDPNGGWTPLGFATGTIWTMEAWIYRPSGYGGGGSDRVAVEDADFDGYGTLVNHAGNSFAIERRTGGSGSTLASTSFNPPEDAWYRVVLARSGSSLVAGVYDTGGSQLALVSATDSTHAGAERFVVHGGWEYYVDDITLTAAAANPTTIAVDTMGNLGGDYVGSPDLGVPSIVAGEIDTAVAFDGSNHVLIGDHPLLNTSTRSQRTAEMWFRADAIGGRQVVYEEGGGTNGMVIYLDGSTLRARAWSNSTNWSNDLDTSTTVSAGVVYHVVVTLDTAASPNLILYLNGAQVDSASKSDTRDWNAHSDDGAIANQNGTTRYHDGTSSGSNPFTGVIDEVAIYNTILSPSRVAAHWSAGS